MLLENNVTIDWTCWSHIAAETNQFTWLNVSNSSTNQ
jgi:hypothetical protein